MSLGVLLKFFIPILILSATLFVKITVAYADINNFAPNPSFEEGTNIPNGWYPIKGEFCWETAPNYQVSFEWDNNQSRSGTKSIAIKDISWQSTSWQTPVTWISDPINLENKDQDYVINVYSQTSANSTNLQPVIIFCATNSEGNYKGGYRGVDKHEIVGDWTRSSLFIKTSLNGLPITKMGVGTTCLNGNCSGSIWFDDISLTPIYKVKIMKFYDRNKNSIYDSGDWTFQYWGMKLFKGKDCMGIPINKGNTEVNGTVTLFGYEEGEHSILEASLPPGADETYPFQWISTTGGFCQNITLKANEIPEIRFGNIPVLRKPPFPYFSQKDPAWRAQEYDSANTFGPFFCGTTLAQCGCATTSSAMLLKYYGVDKSPTGDPTSPQSLDNWLKQNNGYAFGAVKWNSIAAYSVKANQAFNTQKIKFSGYGSANDFSTLDTELASDRPTILQEPGHFIVASQKQSPTYSIADPAWENRKTLQSYGDTFRSMRRFEKTNTDLSAIYIATPAPTELLITDSEGRKTGKDATGNIYNQIPNSHYALEPAFSNPSSENPQDPPENLGVNTLIILTPDLQNYALETFSQSPAYSIEFSSYDEDGDITTQGFDQTTADQYDIEYSEVGNHFEFFQTVEIDARHSAKSNPFNPNARILPVSILASGDFDPQTVDINTIETGPNWNLLKASTILIGPRLQNEKSLLLLLENNGNYEEEICIRGKTLSGKPFRGCDLITVVGNDP